MILVYIGLFLIFLVQFSENQTHKNVDFSIIDKNKKKYFYTCVAVAMFFFLISAFKEIGFNNGTGDLINYNNRYGWLVSQSYSGLIELYVAQELKDIGFYLVAKVFVDLGIPVSIWMGAIAFLFAASVGALLYKYSDNPTLSALIVLALYFSFTITGLRQTVALSLVLIAYPLMVEKKLTKFIGLVVLAGFFHSSAWIFLPAYWIAKIRGNKKQFLIILISLLIAVFAPGIVRTLVANFAWTESMSRYAETTVSLSWAGYIIQIFIYIFCIFFRGQLSKQARDQYEYINPLLACMTIGICIQGFSGVIAEAFRASYYYSIGCIVVVPAVISGNRLWSNRRVMILIVAGSLLGYMFWSGAYKDLLYFWQV